MPPELEEPDAEDWKYALDGVIADTKGAEGRLRQRRCKSTSSQECVRQT